MDAKTTLEHWKSFARAHSHAGADNYFTVDASNLGGGVVSYFFDAHPKQFENGALQGHVFLKHPGAGIQDLGVYKISADGRILALPEDVAAFLTYPEPHHELDPDAA